MSLCLLVPVHHHRINQTVSRVTGVARDVFMRGERAVEREQALELDCKRETLRGSR